MKDLSYRLSILGLILIILGLVYKLLSSESVATTTPQDAPKERDLFNYAGLSQRQEKVQEEIDQADITHKNRLRRITK